MFQGWPVCTVIIELSYRESEAVADVAVAVASVKRGPAAVHGQESHPVGTEVVNRMRIGIAEHEVEPMEIASGESILPTMVG